MTPEQAQRAEITEHHIYLHLASKAEGRNKRLLEHIAADELRHYRFWKTNTGKEYRANKLHVWWYSFLASTFGLMFALKLRESRERRGLQKYKHLKGGSQLIRDETIHEQHIISMLQDDRLTYASSVVLGLNDGLIELTGVLAGLTFALANNRLIALAGLITGIAAALSMAASGYFASKEDHKKNPVISALYTGIAYLIVVILLILPYLLIPNIYDALIITLIIAVLLIAGYTFYISVAKGESFSRRFLEMLIISLLVAAISFGVGIGLRNALGV